MPFASLGPTKSTASYSLARYDPKFFSQPRPLDWEKKALERSLKVLSHETCHMMGMSHCTFFHCLMNGSNHLQELDRQSNFLCPVCLRKLRHALNIDLLERYKNLEQFYNRAGLSDQGDWLRSLLGK